MHESGIKPLQKMKFKGVIWYQGESNAHDPELYLQMFRKLIQSWRQFFHQPELPFLYVQLPNLENGINWPEFREVQRRSLSMPATGMAVTIDVGDPRDVHPRLKLPVGHRIALIARAIAYGESIEYSGPLVQSAILKDKNIQVNFSHSENGLKTSDGNGPSSLEVAGNDGVFRSVTGEIQGGSIVIATGNLNGPFQLRYGWAPNPKCNLQNREGLPASPFQIRVEEK
jgi:sialate O-acetylesterase